VLVNALVSPVLGRDERPDRRPPAVLLVFTGITVVGSAAIGLTDSAAIGLTLFAIANFGYQAALIYYDSTLPLVARGEARGRVSGIGVAIGYLGTIVIALLILILDSQASPITFFLAAALFAIFAIPIFVVVREPLPATAGRFSVRDAVGSWSQLRTSIRHALEVPGLGRFLLGRFFYTDPVNTVIVVMSCSRRGDRADQEHGNVVLLS
jgi:UMF1 family MFS transporter